MRTLKFIVNKQIIMQDPKCNFDGLIPGTEGYLKAEFIFSSDWRESTKVAAFFSPLGKEYQPQKLEDGRTCVIPAEALKYRKFKIQAIGRKGDTKLITNKLTVSQNGGKG